MSAFWQNLTEDEQAQSERLDFTTTARQPPSYQAVYDQMGQQLDDHAALLDAIDRKPQPYADAAATLAAQYEARGEQAPDTSAQMRQTQAQYPFGNPAPELAPATINDWATPSDTTGLLQNPIGAFLTGAASKVNQATARPGIPQQQQALGRQRQEQATTEPQAMQAGEAVAQYPAAAVQPYAQNLDLLAGEDKTLGQRAMGGLGLVGGLAFPEATMGGAVAGRAAANVTGNEAVGGAVNQAVFAASPGGAGGTALDLARNPTSLLEMLKAAGVTGAGALVGWNTYQQTGDVAKAIEAGLTAMNVAAPVGALGAGAVRLAGRAAVRLPNPANSPGPLGITSTPILPAEAPAAAPSRLRGNLPETPGAFPTNLRGSTEVTPYPSPFSLYGGSAVPRPGGAELPTITPREVPPTAGAVPETMRGGLGVQHPTTPFAYPPTSPELPPYGVEQNPTGILSAERGIQGRTASVETPPQPVSPVVRQLSEQLAPQIVKNGGATWNLRDGDYANTPRFAVGIYPELTRKIPGPAEAVTPQVLNDYVMEHYALLADNRHSLGAWYDPAEQTTWLDVVVTTPDQQQAVALGQRYNQKAITGLKDLNEINTGGTGEVLPGWEPINERLDAATQLSAPAVAPTGLVPGARLPAAAGRPQGANTLPAPGMAQAGGSAVQPAQAVPATLRDTTPAGFVGTGTTGSAGPRFGAIDLGPKPPDAYFTGKPGPGATGIIAPGYVARRVGFTPQIPTEAQAPGLRDAVTRAGGTIDQQGVTLTVTRTQDPAAEALGRPATSGAVFYTVGGPEASRYVREGTTPGATSGVVTGETTFQRPLVTTGVVGELSRDLVDQGALDQATIQAARGNPGSLAVLLRTAGVPDAAAAAQRLARYGPEEDQAIASAHEVVAVAAARKAGYDSVIALRPNGSIEEIADLREVRYPGQRFSPTTLAGNVRLRPTTDIRGVPLPAEGGTRPQASEQAVLANPQASVAELQRINGMPGSGSGALAGTPRTRSAFETPAEYRQYGQYDAQGRRVASSHYDYLKSQVLDYQQFKPWYDEWGGMLKDIATTDEGTLRPEHVDFLSANMGATASQAAPLTNTFKNLAAALNWNTLLKLHADEPGYRPSIEELGRSLGSGTGWPGRQRLATAQEQAAGAGQWVSDPSLVRANGARLGGSPAKPATATAPTQRAVSPMTVMFPRTDVVKARNILTTGRAQVVSGAKTATFGQNLEQGALRPQDYNPFAVEDTHIFRNRGYTSLSSTNKSTVHSNLAAYRATDGMTEALANDLGWTVPQVQAAEWYASMTENAPRSMAHWQATVPIPVPKDVQLPGGMGTVPAGEYATGDIRAAKALLAPLIERYRTEILQDPKAPFHPVRGSELTFGPQGLRSEAGPWSVSQNTLTEAQIAQREATQGGATATTAGSLPAAEGAPVVLRPGQAGAGGASALSQPAEGVGGILRDVATPPGGATTPGQRATDIGLGLAGAAASQYGTNAQTSPQERIQRGVTGFALGARAGPALRQLGEQGAALGRSGITARPALTPLGPQRSTTAPAVRETTSARQLPLPGETAPPGAGELLRTHPLATAASIAQSGPLALPSSLTQNATAGLARTVQRVAQEWPGGVGEGMTDVAAMFKGWNQAVAAAKAEIKSGPSAELARGLTSETRQGLENAPGKAAAALTAGVRLNVGTDRLFYHLNKIGAEARATRQGKSALEIAQAGKTAGEFATYRGQPSPLAVALTSARKVVDDPNASKPAKAAAVVMMGMAPYVRTPERVLVASLKLATDPATQLPTVAKVLAKKVAGGAQELTPAEREAVGRFGVGALLGTAVLAGYVHGDVHGAPPQDQALRRRMEADGVQWNTWNGVPLRNFGTFGDAASALATVAQGVEQGLSKGKGDWGQGVQAGLSQAMAWTLDKSYLSDFQRASADIHAGKGSQVVVREAANVGLRPLAAVTSLAGAFDPYQRKTSSAGIRGEILSRVPGGRYALPKQQNELGQPLLQGSNAVGRIFGQTVPGGPQGGRIARYAGSKSAAQDAQIAEATRVVQRYNANPQANPKPTSEQRSLYTIFGRNGESAAYSKARDAELTRQRRAAITAGGAR